MLRSGDLRTRWTFSNSAIEEWSEGENLPSRRVVMADLPIPFARRRCEAGRLHSANGNAYRTNVQYKSRQNCVTFQRNQYRATKL